MPEAKTPALGSIAWIDLTVPDAEALRDFYASVAGWRFDPVSMGDYEDYCLLPPGSDAPVAGVCHARGANAKLPSQWLIYISVRSLAASIERCLALGGKLLDGPRPVGKQQFCVIQDPSGAVAGLIEG